MQAKKSGTFAFVPFLLRLKFLFIFRIGEIYIDYDFLLSILLKIVYILESDSISC
jgi:hypothetical protein